MTKSCVVCSGVSPEVKFAGTHKACNKCRAIESREYRAEYGRRIRANQTDEDRRKHAERSRRDRAANPHLTFHMTSRYLAKKADVLCDLTPECALGIYNLPNDCAYCGKSIDTSVKRSLHIDHVIPMSQGGPNSRWNLVKVCNSCNSSKNFNSLVDFRERTPEFTAERYNHVINEMVRLSGRSKTEVNMLIAQSHAFELAFARERQRMLGAITEFSA